MILTLHGTGAGTPGADRFASATTMRFADGSLVLLDAGEACARGMIRDGVDINSIIDVAISHMHTDHWSGLPGLITGWATLRRTSVVTVRVPRGTIEFFRLSQRMSLSFPEKLGFELEYRELGLFEAREGWHVEPFATSHLDGVAELAVRYGASTPAHGYVLRNGDRRVVMSQDIGAIADLDPHLSGAEILICESAHVDPEQVLMQARSCGVERVILTHVSPKKPISGDFEIAFDGTSIEI